MSEHSRLADLSSAVMLYSPVYLGWAMRRVHGQNWPWTLIKSAVLLAVNSVAQPSLGPAAFEAAFIDPTN